MSVDSSAIPPPQTRLSARQRVVSTAAVIATASIFGLTYGLTAPPDGYHSCHGVRARALRPSQFADDEYVVYDVRQQRLEYLVEFAA